MGYTHYFTPKRFTQKQWNKFAETCQTLHDNLPKSTDSAGGNYIEDPLEIASGNGEGTPVFSKKTMIDFNGKGELSHETFRIYADCQKNKWDFCKTARKPYDLLVVACLIAGWQNEILLFSSDGFNRDGKCDDLLPAMNFYNAVVKPNIPITQEDLSIQREEHNKIK